MNKLPKAKRDQLILVGMGTLVLLVLIGLALIRPQYATISAINSKITEARSHLDSMEETSKKADTITAQLADLTQALTQSESDLATGDPSQWIYNTVRNFKENYKVDVSVNSQLSMGEVDLLPHFPYKQLKVSVVGTAYYHDLGKFIADFENTFPHARITNLTLEPASPNAAGANGENGEKLTFRMDIVALANPTGSQG
jgi:hypothetical protein